MKAIVLLFDSLKKDWLPPYGGDILAPNFARLAGRCLTFDNFYVGSLPCMPARREMHTGRYNFLHEGWGPWNPLTTPWPQLLKEKGVHTHLVSDTTPLLAGRAAPITIPLYTTYEHIRGQEGDP
jgi:arylsulfatase A-like enzyme